VNSYLPSPEGRDHIRRYQVGRLERWGLGEGTAFPSGNTVAITDTAGALIRIGEAPAVSRRTRRALPPPPVHRSNPNARSQHEPRLPNMQQQATKRIDAMMG
jgi:hypothetical protein